MPLPPAGTPGLLGGHGGLYSPFQPPALVLGGGSPGQKEAPTRWVCLSGLRPPSEDSGSARGPGRAVRCPDAWLLEPRLPGALGFWGQASPPPKAPLQPHVCAFSESCRMACFAGLGAVLGVRGRPFLPTCCDTG